ncbi:MAG: type I-D CRISPR-associated helicase Cas3' [Caldilineaceae bacterium]
MSVEITLLPHFEKLAPSNQYRETLLYHQWRTVEALQHSPLVMNTYNTGTGKTRASLLHLFHLPQDREAHVLFIAPTNELLHQHVNDIADFVKAHNLPFRVIEVNANLLRQLAAPDVVDRQGERLTRLLRNPLEFHQQLGIDLSDQRKLNLILITNPDLFYYAFYWQFSAADQRNLFQTFVTRFRYIVIDEFHYYNSKQLGNFLLFMVLSRQFGYFTANTDGSYERQMCLLSATPDDQTRIYLDSIFGAAGWTLIAPENEPATAATLPKTPVLAPLHLTIQAGKINELAEQSATTIRQWLQSGEDGALISGALWRVNQAYAALRYLLSDEEMGRITGAQPVIERRRDQYKPLILATPTVDIGYNFLKHAKVRQNLDFVIFDAHFQDEFIQRLGRAGRVLGKPETDTPSRAVALVSEEAVAACAALQGCTLTRSSFNTFLREQGAIPQRDDFRTYLHAGGMIENAYPILRAREMFARSEEAILEQAFDAVKEVFASQSNWNYRGLLGYWSKYWKLERWLQKPQESKLADNAGLMAEFLGWSMGQAVSVEDVQDSFAELLQQKALRASFRWWCEMRHAFIRAHFSFRDSFSGPVAWVYDPQHLLSSATVTQYDLIHLVENYDFEMLDPKNFAEKSHQQPSADDLCIYLHRHRQQRQHVTLRWTPPKLFTDGWNELSFQRAFAAGVPVAINGLVLKGDEPLPTALRVALEKQFVPALLTPTALQGNLLRILQPRGVYTRDLYVQLAQTEVKFLAVLGTNALLAAPLLHWVFGLHQRQVDTALIC